MKILKPKLLSETLRSRNPITQKWEDAEWLPDYFSKDCYGVKFSTHVFDQRYVDIWVDRDTQVSIMKALQAEQVTKRIYEPYQNWRTKKGGAAANATKKTTDNQKPSAIAAESHTEAMRRMQEQEN